MLDKLNKSNPLRYNDKCEKKIKKKILLYFDPIVWLLRNGIEETPLQQFLLSSLYLLDSIFTMD